ncbi:DNA gyrase subunit B, chloroplastic/mitochondrial [Tanacetum coccineum]
MRGIMRILQLTNTLILRPSLKCHSPSEKGRSCFPMHQPQPAGAPTNAYVDLREEVSELRRQVEILTERLTQLEPPHEEEEFELNDAFENPFHRHARHREQPMHRRMCLKTKKVKWVAIKLKGRASTWLEQLQLMRERRGKQKIIGIKSVEEYTEEFYELVLRNDILDCKEQLVSRYLGGLRQSIQDALCLYTFWSVLEAYQRALEVEKQQKKIKKSFWRITKTKYVESKQVKHGDKSQEQDAAISKRPTVFRGSGSGTGNNTSSSNQNIKCFKCGEPCHKSSTCRKERGKQLMMEIEKLETYDYEDEVKYNVEPRYDEDEEYEDNFVYGDVGQMLVIRKSLLVPKEEEKDEWL